MVTSGSRPLPAPPAARPPPPGPGPGRAGTRPAPTGPGPLGPLRPSGAGTAGLPPVGNSGGRPGRRDSARRPLLVGGSATGATSPVRSSQPAGSVRLAGAGVSSSPVAPSGWSAEPRRRRPPDSGPPGLAGGGVRGPRVVAPAPNVGTDGGATGGGRNGPDAAASRPRPPRTSPLAGSSGRSRAGRPRPRPVGIPAEPDGPPAGTASGGDAGRGSAGAAPRRLRPKPLLGSSPGVGSERGRPPRRSASQPRSSSLGPSSPRPPRPQRRLAGFSPSESRATTAPPRRRPGPVWPDWVRRHLTTMYANGRPARPADVQRRVPMDGSTPGPGRHQGRTAA